MSEFVGSGDKWYDENRKKKPCPKCGSRDVTTLILDGKRNSRCWDCGNKWKSPIISRKV